MGQYFAVSELPSTVALLAIHLGWRERLKNFLSPVGSFSPICTDEFHEKSGWILRGSSHSHSSGWAS